MGSGLPPRSPALLSSPYVLVALPSERASGVTAGRVDARLAQAILYGAQKLPEPPIYVASKRASTRPRSRAAWGADLTVR